MFIYRLMSILEDGLKEILKVLITFQRHRRDVMKVCNPMAKHNELMEKFNDHRFSRT